MRVSTCSGSRIFWLYILWRKICSPHEVNHIFETRLFLHERRRFRRSHYRWICSSFVSYSFEIHGRIYLGTNFQSAHLLILPLFLANSDCMSLYPIRNLERKSRGWKDDEKIITCISRLMWSYYHVIFYRSSHLRCGNGNRPATSKIWGIWSFYEDFRIVEFLSAFHSRGQNGKLEADLAV